MSDNTEEQSAEIKRPEIKVGKYEFLISGVIRTDSNGYELKTQKGATYSRLKILLLNEENNSSVSKPIFSEKDIKEAVYGISNPALTHAYNYDPKNFELETFIGETGFLFLGKKNGYNNIECFIKPKASDIDEKKESNEASQSFKQELEQADGVPF